MWRVGRERRGGVPSIYGSDFVAVDAVADVDDVDAVDAVDDVDARVRWPRFLTGLAACSAMWRCGGVVSGCSDGPCSGGDSFSLARGCRSRWRQGQKLLWRAGRRKQRLPVRCRERCEQHTPSESPRWALECPALGSVVSGLGGAPLAHLAPHAVLPRAASCWDMDGIWMGCGRRGGAERDGGETRDSGCLALLVAVVGTGGVPSVRARNLGGLCDGMQRSMLALRGSWGVLP